MKQNLTLGRAEPDQMCACAWTSPVVARLLLWYIILLGVACAKSPISSAKLKDTKQSCHTSQTGTVKVASWRAASRTASAST